MLAVIYELLDNGQRAANQNSVVALLMMRCKNVSTGHISLLLYSFYMDRLLQKNRRIQTKVFSSLRFTPPLTSPGTLNSRFYKWDKYSRVKWIARYAKVHSCECFAPDLRLSLAQVRLHAGVWEPTPSQPRLPDPIFPPVHFMSLTHSIPNEYKWVFSLWDRTKTAKYVTKNTG